MENIFEPSFARRLERALESSVAEDIRKSICRASVDYGLIEPNDRIMVAVSGGKDSTILALLLKEIQKYLPFSFHFETVILDQKQPGFDNLSFKQLWAEVGIVHHILERDTYSIVKAKTVPGQAYCALCSKYRRAILYDFTVEKGFNKLALGHHQSDAIETLILNLFFSGKISSMPPKLRSDDDRVTVIRPLAYVTENQLIELRDMAQFPVIPCNLCGSQEGLQRAKIKDLLAHLEKDNPWILKSLGSSLKNVRPSQLADPNLWNFKEISSVSARQ